MNKVLLLFLFFIIFNSVYIVFTAPTKRATDTIISPTNSLLHYVGRIDKTQSDNGQYYAFSWSASQIIVNISGITEITAIINSQQVNWFDIFINNELISNFNVTLSEPQQQEIKIASNLNSNEIYKIVISKRTEAEFGEVRFYGFIVDNPNFEIYKYSPPTNRKFEYIGDSILTGYGDMGHAPCAFTESTENVDVSFSTVITNELGGEQVVIGWEGLGVIKNYGSSTPTSNGTLPDYYPYILPLSDNSSLWNPQNFVPDVIIVNLGANDYTNPPYPSQQQFESTFISFIKSILSGYLPYGQPKLVFICGVMIGDPVTCTYTENVSNVFNATYIYMSNIQDSSSDFGCYGHPTVIAHYHMAQIAIPIIKNLMNWE